jgi:hypothetical protein
MMGGPQICNNRNCYESNCEDDDEDCHSNFDTISEQYKKKTKQQSTK